jgi:WhiB family transcriptional regulator, redox-sensing transcriptional regulator
MSPPTRPHRSATRERQQLHECGQAASPEAGVCGQSRRVQAAGNARLFRAKIEDALHALTTRDRHLPGRTAMAATAQFRIGAGASCSGEVSRVVTGPVARTVTHLVAGPNHRRGLRRLVPLRPVGAVTGEIRLRSTIHESGRPAPPGRHSSCLEAAATGPVARNSCAAPGIVASAVGAVLACASLLAACNATGRVGPRSLGWMSRGACRQADPELFFPVSVTGTGLRQAEAAKTVCCGCAVRANCLRYALRPCQRVSGAEPPWKSARWHADLRPAGPGTLRNSRSRRVRQRDGLAGRPAAGTEPDRENAGRR